jgi:hypothetical protein
MGACTAFLSHVSQNVTKKLLPCCLDFCAVQLRTVQLFANVNLRRDAHESAYRKDYIGIRGEPDVVLQTEAVFSDHG